MTIVYENGRATQYYVIEPEHMHTRMTKRNCSICHGRMEQGERVNVSLQWEYPCEIERRDGTVADAYRMHGRSAKVCRKCAEEIAEKIGFEIPEEAR